MGFFNEKLVEALFSGRYICSECGAEMDFEDERKDVLICPSCGHSVELERYGFENDEAYDALFPSIDEIIHSEEDEDEEYTGEIYDEVCGELSDD